MAEIEQGSDMKLGLGLLFVLVVLLASAGTAAAAYSAELQSSDTMQLLSGVTLTVAVLAGCLAVVAVHVFE